MAEPDLFSNVAEEAKPETAPEPTGPIKESDCSKYGFPYEGKRYDVGLQDKTELTKFKDFFQTDSKKEAEEVAAAKAKETGRDTLVYDRIGMGVVVRIRMQKPEEPKAEKNVRPGGKEKITRK